MSRNDRESAGVHERDTPPHGATALNATRFKPYTDPTTGEFVGEFEYRDPHDSTVTRRLTEWFATEPEAQRFARSGPAETAPTASAAQTGRRS